jgi:hypothetical protein
MKQDCYPLDSNVEYPNKNFLVVGVYGHHYHHHTFVIRYNSIKFIFHLYRVEKGHSLSTNSRKALNAFAHLNTVIVGSNPTQCMVVRVNFVLYSWLGRPPLWSIGQSSWLQNGDVLCFL